MSLAIADFLVALIVMPLSIIDRTVGYFPFGYFLCNAWISMDVLLCTSSIWHMCTMSLDRYFTIKFPLKYGHNKTIKFMLYKIVFAWLISLLTCSPIFILGLIHTENVYNKNNRQCMLNNSFFKIYGSICAFYIPFIIMAISYMITMLETSQDHHPQITKIAMHILYTTPVLL